MGEMKEVLKGLFDSTLEHLDGRLAIKLGLIQAKWVSAKTTHVCINCKKQ